MTDVPTGGGFELASAFVQVDPNAETFEAQLEEQLAGVNYVVTIPVEADTAGLQESVDAAAAEAKATVTVPVTADGAGLKESVDAAAADSGAVVTVPLEADPANLAPQAEAAGTEAGDAAGTSFGEMFSSVASRAALFAPDEAQMDALAATAGEGSGTSFASAFNTGTAALTAGLADLAPEANAAGATAGEEGGASFASRFASALTGLNGMFAGLLPAAEAEGAAAGEAGGASFTSRFAAMVGYTGALNALVPEAEAEGAAAGEAGGVSFATRFAAAMAGLGGTLEGMLPTFEAEGAADGAATGEGFVGSMKTVLMGGMGPMEAIIGVAFVAAAADMASKFQSAMEMIHTQAGVGQSAIAGLSSQVESLAGQVGTSPTSLAQALYHVESTFQSTGITGANAMNMLTIAAEGARVGGSNLIDTQNALDATIRSGVTGISSASQAMGVLNSIVGAGDMTMQNLGESMGTGLMANAKLYGQSIQQVGAALATLGDNNIRGAKAATDFRMAMQAMASPLATAGPMLNSIGLSMTALGNTMRTQGFSSAVQEFVQHLQASKVPINDWGEYVTQIFGKKAGAGIGVLVGNLSTLQSKFPDMAKAANDFGGAWAATEATTSQHVHDLEAAFEALMIKIGSALLPTLDKLMGDISNGLPGLEKFGASLAHLVAPIVATFFQGLSAIFKDLGSFLDKNQASFEKFGTTLVKMATPVLKTFFSNLITDIKLLVADVEGWLPHFEALGEAIAKLVIPAVGLFFTGLGAIIHLLLGPLKDVTLAVALFAAAWLAMELVSGIGWIEIIIAGLVMLVGLIVKYHQDIWNAIVGTWNKIMDFIKAWWPLLLGVATGGLSLIVGVVIKYHNDIFNAIKDVWNAIVSWVTSKIGDLRTGIEYDWVGIKTDAESAWNLVYTYIINPIEKAYEWVVSKLAILRAGILDDWDLIKTDSEAAWNLVSTYIIDPIQNAYNWVTSKIGGLVSWLAGKWDTVKTDVHDAFTDVETDIENIWNNIVSWIEGKVKDIESAVSGLISSLPGSGVIGGALKAVGLAGGGIVPGPDRGKDTTLVPMRGGEGVLVPEAVKGLGGAGFVHAANAHFSGGGSSRGFSAGGIVPAQMGYSAHAYGAAQGYASGGIVPAPAPTMGPALAMNGQEYGERIGGSGGINIYFTGMQMPTPEQMQALVMQLTSAVGVAG